MSETKGKNPDYFVLVNEDHRLPDGFEDTVERIPAENVAGNQFQVEKRTYDAFLRLQQDVLKNNGITYTHNYHFNKYFLDFYIEINNRKIDLEIDGKQHNYPDRIVKDKERDEFVLSNNIEVYRISWNSINTKKGKIIMKEKIDNFLKFIKQ